MLWQGVETDVLIGSDFYREVFIGNVARGENRPADLETKVCRVLSRAVDKIKNKTHTNFISHTYVLKITYVKKFWDLESIAIQENEKSMYQELSDEICIKSNIMK